MYLEILEITKEESYQNTIKVTATVKVPYDYKNAFKRFFKKLNADYYFSSNNKTWVVYKYCTTKEEEQEFVDKVHYYVEMKNKRIKKGTAVENGQRDLAMEKYYEKLREEELIEETAEDLMISKAEARIWLGL